MLVNIWYKDQRKIALLVKEGRKYNYFVVYTDLGVRLARLSTAEGYALAYDNGVCRAPSYYASQYLALGRSRPDWITKGAKQALEAML